LGLGFFGLGRRADAEHSRVGVPRGILIGTVAWLIGRVRPDILAPFGLLIARMMHHRNNRLAIMIIWWWLGWHFFTV